MSAHRRLAALLAVACVAVAALAWPVAARADGASAPAPSPPASSASDVLRGLVHPPPMPVHAHPPTMAAPPPPPPPPEPEVMAAPAPPAAKALAGATGGVGGAQGNAWIAMSAPPSQPWTGRRPRVFTYVLSGDVGGARYDGGNERVIVARAGLAALLHEVEAASAAADVDDASFALSNLFCVPAPAVVPVGAAGDPLLGYDFVLAANYRRAIATLLADDRPMARHLGQPGPFLVAFRLPVAEVRREPDAAPPPGSPNDVLMIDMSDAPAAAIPVYVSSFKSAVRREGSSGDTALAPLRARFAAALVELNQALPAIEEAYAGTVKPLEAGAGEGGAPGGQP
ncbi:MAG: hypothetical protein ACTHL8_14215 [Burkholderiaceae bacterium]